MVCGCLRVLFVWLGGQSEPYLSWLYVSRPFYNKSIICFNKLRVNMCEENDFLKALMPCRGRKIIIYPAGSFTKYWNHISNFCFHLELLWVDGHMFYFQLFFYFFFFFFAYVMIFRNVEQNSELMVSLSCFFLAREHAYFMGKLGRTILQVIPLDVGIIGRRACFLKIFSGFGLVS